MPQSGRPVHSHAERGNEWPLSHATPCREFTIRRIVLQSNALGMELVYELYGLTDKEITIVEEATAR